MIPTDDSGTSSTGETPSTVTLPPTADVTGSTTDVVDTTATTGEDSTSTGEPTGDDTTTTGDEVVPGQTVNQLVTAGQRTGSGNYTLVYTLGQPSQLQSTHDSTNYRIQGGLIGANGSPP